MPCKTIPLPGGFAIACSRGGPRCSAPGCSKASAKQCDYPVTRKGKAGTCDAHLCAGHAQSGGPEIDWCPPHARLKAREGL